LTHGHGVAKQNRAEEEAQRLRPSSVHPVEQGKVHASGILIRVGAGHVQSIYLAQMKRCWDRQTAMQGSSRVTGLPWKPVSATAWMVGNPSVTRPNGQ